MTIKTIKVLIISIILLGVIVTAIFFKKNYVSHEDFYIETVKNEALESYHGIVINKFYDKYNHGRDIIVLDQGVTEIEVDLVYQNPNLYKFIEIGDTLIKKKKSLNLQIKRKNFDTIIQFKFENIKGYERFKSPLKLVDSLN